MKKPIDMIAMILLIIGGLNWGLVGINRSWDLVNLIFGSVEWLASIIYILVGIAAIWGIIMMTKKE